MFCLLFITLCFHHATGDYQLTVPQKWIYDEGNEVCLFTKQPLQSQSSLSIKVYSYYQSPPRTSFQKPEDNKFVYKVLQSVNQSQTFAENQTHSCVKVAVAAKSPTYGDVQITGTVNGKEVNQTSEVTFASHFDNLLRYIVTDRPKYRAGDTVNFILLSVNPVTLDVNYKNSYNWMWVESPSSTNFKTWYSLNNEKGMIHRNFTLTDKPEIGNYTIFVGTTMFYPQTNTTFKVVDYHLPQFKVKITPPKSVLATEPNLTIKVCAIHNFGIQLKGQLVGTADNGGRFGQLTNLNFNDTIHGCTNLNINLTKLEINLYNNIAGKVNIKLQVLEEGTENVLDERVTIPISRIPIEMENTRLFRYRKPGISFVMRIRVKTNDGTPASLEPISVCAGEKCANATSDMEGYLQFSFPPHMHYQKLKLTALNHPKLEVGSGDSKQLYMHAPVYHFHPEDYYSPSNSSLQILPSSFEEIKCTTDIRKVESLKIKILYAVPSIIETNLNVMLISRGKIRYSEVIPVVFDAKDLPSDINLLLPMESSSTSGESGYRGSWEMSLDVLYNISPEFTILIWYTSPDGEIVADSYNMKMEECLKNKVTMSWSDAKPGRGQPTTVTVEAEPDSFCNIGVDDAKVEGTSTLLLSKIMKSVRNQKPDSVTANQVNDYEYCKQKLGGENDTSSNYVSDYVDATKMFDNAGIFIKSDSSFNTRPCKAITSQNGGQSKLKDGFHKEASIIFYGRDKSDDNYGRDNFLSHQEEGSYDYSLETFLWEPFSVDSKGQYSKELSFSGVDPEYSGMVVCVHPTKGVGVSDATLITPFVPFYVEAKGTPSLRLGENIIITTTVYSNISSSLPMKLTMEASNHLEIVKSDGKVVVDQLGGSERVLEVPANGRAVWTLEIKPKRAMNVLLNFTAAVDSSFSNYQNHYTSQRVLKSVRVIHEGFPKEIVQSRYICGKGADEATFKMEIPERYQVTPNSVETWVTVDGELLRPTINNIENILPMPTGVGEPTMLHFTSAIYAYECLHINRRYREKDVIKTWISKGHESVLKFRNPHEASFSQFMSGSRYSGSSSWLTAYAIKAMKRFDYIDFLLVDNDLLLKMVWWLKSTQIKEDVTDTNTTSNIEDVTKTNTTSNLHGCFNVIGKPVHNGFKGDPSDSEIVMMTSYAVVALIETGDDANKESISKAIACINRAPESDYPYALALKAHALVLAQNETAEEAVQSLLRLAVNTSETTYWNISEGASSTFEIETAGYAILAMLNQDYDYFDTATKVMKWMTTKRNSQGGFISSQDTNVALEAAVLYERSRRKLFSGKDEDLQVYLSIGDNEEVIRVDNDNKNQTGKMEMEVSVPSELKVRTNGTGCATLQTVIKFNEEQAEPGDSFSFNIYSDEGRKENSKTLTICARYLASNVSNLVMMDVNLMSGFVPKKSSLKTLYQLGLFGYYEVTEGGVVFYFDEMSRDEPNCVELEISRETEVTNMKHGTVKIFDYYRPELFSTEKFI